MNNIHRCKNTGCSKICREFHQFHHADDICHIYKDAPAKTHHRMNRLFEDAQTSPLKLAGVQAVAGRDRGTATVECFVMPGS